jgi:hypothetical protein
VEALRLLDAEGLDLLELARDQPVVVRVAQEPERQDPVDHRGIDAAEPTGGGHPRDEPVVDGADGAASPGSRSKGFPRLEEAIDTDEEVLPRPQRAARIRRVVEVEVMRPQLVDAPLARDGVNRPTVHDHQEGNEDRP